MKIYLLQSTEQQEDGSQTIVIYKEFFLLLEQAQKAAMERDKPTAVLEFEFTRAWTPEQIKAELDESLQRINE